MNNADIFPIVRDVIYRSTHYKKVMEKGTLVKCIWCGNSFRVQENNVSITEDGMQMIKCPNRECRMKAPVLNYFDRIVDEKRDIPKTKKHKDTNYHRVTDENRTYRGTEREETI